MTESTSKYFSKSYKTRRQSNRTAKRKYQSSEPVKIRYEETKSEEKINIKKIKNEQQSHNNEDDGKACWFPKNWKELLENIKEMRKDRTAVVDSQGCERTADMNEPPEVCLAQ